MENLRNVISGLFESTAVRIFAGLVALGAVPFYLLSMAAASLTN